MDLEIQQLKKESIVICDKEKLQLLTDYIERGVDDLSTFDDEAMASMLTSFTLNSTKFGSVEK